MGTGGVLLRRLRARLSDEPTGFAWVDDHRLAASGFPASRGQLEWLVRQGINSIITLTEGPLPAEWVAGLPTVVTHLPMKDHGVPSVEALAKGADVIDDQLREGKNVLVHCLGGEGRTGCVLAAYLIAKKEISAADALRSLRATKAAFVERRQEPALSDFAATLAEKSRDQPS